jgi:predicted nucleic acid-binding protein
MIAAVAARTGSTLLILDADLDRVADVIGIDVDDAL